jgi:cytochrome c
MKLNFIFSSVFIGFLSYGFSTSAQTKKPVTPKKAVVVAAVKALIATPLEIEAGKLLISKSDCMACHGIDNKMVGPSYGSVSEKYPFNMASVANLSKKIINGGSGVWGTVPMIPHASLSQEDADKMVKYILSLRGKAPSGVPK